MLIELEKMAVLISRCVDLFDDPAVVAIDHVLDGAVALDMVITHAGGQRNRLNSARIFQRWIRELFCHDASFVKSGCIA